MPPHQPSWKENQRMAQVRSHVALLLALAALTQGSAHAEGRKAKPSAAQTCAVYSLAAAGDADYCKWVADTIPQVIDPETWSDKAAKGGTPVITYNAARRVLVVRHTAAVQAKVAAFIKDAEKAGKAGGEEASSERGAVGGGALGAAIGALAAGPRRAGAGVLIGAGAGAKAGASAGASEEGKKRQEAAAARGMSIDEVIRMTESRTDDTLIINQIRTSGSVFVLSSDDIVRLQTAGVSPRVITEMQATAARRPAVYKAEKRKAAPGMGQASDYPVPPPGKQPRHLIHFIIRYEGDGFIDANVVKFARALAEQAAKSAQGGGGVPSGALKAAAQALSGGSRRSTLPPPLTPVPPPPDSADALPPPPPVPE
jgi:hypothetical protein